MLCADDLLTPGALQRAVSVMEDNPGVVAAMGTCLYSTEDGSQIDPAPPRDSWRIWEGPDFIERVIRKNTNVASIVVRTDVQKRLGYYKPELPYTDDLEMLLRFAGAGRIAETEDRQFVQRLHDANISMALWSSPVDRFRTAAAAFEIFFDADGRALARRDELRTLARNVLAKSAYWSGVSHLVRGRPVEARRLFGFAVEYRPALLLVPPVDQLFRTEKVASRIVNVFARNRKALRAGE